MLWSICDWNSSSSNGSVVKAHIVYVGHRPKRRGQVEIGSCVHQEDAGIYKVGLALLFAGSQVWKKAVGRNQGHSGAGQADAFAIEEAENAPGKRLCLADSIKPAFKSIAGLSVAGGKEPRRMNADPVAV